MFKILVGVFSLLFPVVLFLSTDLLGYELTATEWFYGCMFTAGMFALCAVGIVWGFNLCVLG